MSQKASSEKRGGSLTLAFRSSVLDTWLIQSMLKVPAQEKGILSCSLRNLPLQAQSGRFVATCPQTLIFLWLL